MTNTIIYTALSSFERLGHWLDEAFKTNRGTLCDAVSSLLATEIKSTLENDFEEFKLHDGKITVGQKSIVASCGDPSTLLSTVKYLRLAPKMSALRFSAWAIGFGSDESSLNRLSNLLRNCSPPNDFIVVEKDYPISSEFITRHESLLGVILPPGIVYIDLDSNQPTQLTQNTCILSQETEKAEVKAIGYADMSGTKEWIATLSEFLPENVSKRSLTILSDSIQSGISEACNRCRDALKPEKYIGVGADGVYLVAKSPDLLLRLIIWAQSDLAYKGAAFLPWALDFDIPQFTKSDQPSGDSFIFLHNILDKQANGDVVATSRFIDKLYRPELRRLVQPPDSNQQMTQNIEWWRYPFRKIIL